MKTIVLLLVVSLVSCASPKAKKESHRPKRERYVLDVSEVKTFNELKAVINSLNVQVLFTKEEFDSKELKPFQKFYRKQN